MPPDGTHAGLYERDFYAWTIQQAEAIRAARAAHLANTNDLDWDNIAEEIESLGRSQRSELETRLETIIEHLIKLAFSPANEPRNGWQDTVDRSRARIRKVLRDSPSLRGALPDMIEDAADQAFILASRSMTRYGEASNLPIQAPALTLEQILDDWWPETAS